MQLERSLALSLHQECETCGGASSTEERDERRNDVALFGVSPDPYRVCPQCLDAVSEVTYVDEEFRRRVRLVYIQRGIILRADASGRWSKWRTS
jgi:hypothetical protein